MAFFVLATTALAPPANGQSAQTRQAAPAPGDAELNASHVLVHVGKVGLGHEHAVIGKLRYGHIQLGQPNDAGQLVFDMGTFAADTADARKRIGLPGTTDPSTQAKVTANMVGPQVLNAATYPTAQFDIASARKLAKPSRRGLPVYELAGTLTLHGMQRPLTILAEVEEHDGWHRLLGQFAMRQSDFGIKPFTMAFGAIGVADQLTIYGDIWLLANRPTTKPSGQLAQ